MIKIGVMRNQRRTMPDRWLTCGGVFTGEYVMTSRPGTGLGTATGSRCCGYHVRSAVKRRCGGNRLRAILLQFPLWFAISRAQGLSGCSRRSDRARAETTHVLFNNCYCDYAQTNA
jgi:hypothetical protein